MCGDVLIDLSEDILLGEVGFLNSFNVLKKFWELSELYGVFVLEFLIFEFV